MLPFCALPNIPIFEKIKQLQIDAVDFDLSFLLLLVFAFSQKVRVTSTTIINSIVYPPYSFYYSMNTTL